MYKKKEEICYPYNDPAPEALKEILDPAHTALLMIDMQNDFCSDKGKFAQAGRDASEIMGIIPACKELLDAARRKGVFVVHIRQETLPESLSDNEGWLAFKTRDGKASTYALTDTWGGDFVEPLLPAQKTQEGTFEPVVTKLRPDAFLHTPLDMILHANVIRSVICCGCTTEGCVLATVMGAAFHNYYTCVAEDAVATSVPGAHERAVWLMKKRYIVRTVSQITACW